VHQPSLKPCVCQQVSFSDSSVNTAENKTGATLRPTDYWRLWLLNAVLVSAGVLFFLTSQYGTCEFFGKVLVMALLPFVPVMVLVGGAGSTIFALTKVMIEKRSLTRPTALALLVGPGLLLALVLGLLGLGKSPGHRLAYICAGKAPASATQIQVAGYSTFLREEWLAVFNVQQRDFQAMVASTNYVPVDDFEFKKLLERSSLKKSKLFQNLPPINNDICYKRVFKEKEERERGRIYTTFDSASSTAVVFREYHD
jgi:hypothetical protein